jgi:transcriptional regulator with XRE-family HTH domain/tetratricopeptide (TPR) repeat protein
MGRLALLIREERGRRSLSRRDLAELVCRAGRAEGERNPRVSETTIKRWERGHVPSQGHMRWLASALGEPVHRLVTFARQEASAPANGAQSSAEGPWLEPIDTDYIAGIGATVQRLVGLEIAHGGSVIADLGVSGFRSAQRRLAAGVSPRLTRDLQAAAAEMAEVAGWLLHDADRQEEARQMNNEGLFLARLSGDRSMELFILANASLQALFTRQPGEALMIANAVLDTRDLTSRERVIFTTREARALAQLGDRNGALRRMNDAQAAFWDGASNNDPVWAWWVDAAEVTGHIALAHGDLGDDAKAMELLQRSVEDCPPQRLGAKFIYLAQQIRASLNAKAWSDAEAAIERAIPYVGEVHSTRTLGLLRQAIDSISGSHAPTSIMDAGNRLRHLVVNS